MIEMNFSMFVSKLWNIKQFCELNKTFEWDYKPCQNSGAVPQTHSDTAGQNALYEAAVEAPEDPRWPSAQRYFVILVLLLL